MATTAKRSGKKRMRKANETLRKSPTREGALMGLRSDADLAKAIKQIDNLLLKGALTRYEQALLNALTHAVEKYESHAVEMPAVSDIEMLRHLIEANDLTQVQLAEDTGIAMSTISAILHGKRKMNVSHIRAFAKRFGLKAGAFLP